MFIAFLFGLVLVVSLWPNNRPLFSDFGLKCCLSIGAGFGLVSAHLFLCLVIFGNIDKIIPFELILLPVLVVGSFFVKKPSLKESSLAASIVEHRESVVRGWFTLSAATIVFFSLLWFALRSLNYPHGKSDAWGIWNMRARFLFRSDDQLATVFSNQYGWSHPDYPLLVSSNVARLWQYLGYESLFGPIAIAFLFTAATIGLLYFSLSLFRGSTQGALGVIIILGIRYFIPVGSGQLADMPFAFFILSTSILLYCYHWSEGRQRNYLLLAGAMASFGVWTKNEGQLFIIAVVLAHFLVGVCCSRFVESLKQISTFLLGALPVLFVVLIFKSGFAPANDLISGQNIEATIARIGDLNRLFLIMKAGFHSGTKAIGAYAVILPLCFIFWGWELRKKDRKGLLITVLILLLQAAGYTAVYMTSPHDLNWHVSTSMSRLMLHLLPTFFFIVFMIINPPENYRNNLSGFLFKRG